MLKSRFRERFKWAHVQIGLFFSGFGFSPNTWTALSLAPAILGFAALWSHNLPLGLILFAASGFMDIIDGNVARVTKSVSNLGAFLDGVIDRYVEFSLYVGLLFYLEGTPEVLLPHSLWLMGLFFGALMPSFITAYADHRNVISDPEKLKNMGGLLERFERLLILYAGMLLGIANPVWLTYTVIFTAFAANLTAIQRIYYVIRAS
jgi:archaetidylinositol phosphate synthase